MKNQDFKSSVLELILSIIIPIIFMVIGLFTYIYFKDNSYPVDYEYIDSITWAGYFLSTFIISAIVCILFNVFVTILSVYAKVRSSTVWWVYMILELFISLIFPIYIHVLYPEESNCYIIAFVLFVLMHIMTFVISTANCSKAWKTFFPFSNNKMKRR